MSFPKWFTALVLSLLCLPFRITLADHPFYETVYVVGSERQPLTRTTADASLGRANGSADPVDILQTTLLPIQISNDGRNRNAETISHASGDFASAPLSPVRSSSPAFPATRSLEGDVCNITDTILSFNFDDNFVEYGSYFVPANPSGAVGASRLVAVVSSLMEVRRKNGTLVFRDSLTSFFSGVPEASSELFYNPKVIYDAHESRFILIAYTQRFAPQISRIWLAVSKDDTPDTASDWYFSFINSTVFIGGGNTYAYLLGLDVDEEAVYVTSSMASFTGESNGVRLWVIEKGVEEGGLYSGGPLSFNIIDPFAREGVVVPITPAQVNGSSGGDGSVRIFLVSGLAKNDGHVDIQIVTLFNPLSAAPPHTLQTIPLGKIGSGNVIPAARQLGTTSTILTGVYNALDVVWRNNSMWVVFTIDPSSGVNQGQATAHWVRFRTSGGNVTLEDQGNLGGEGIAGETHTFYPSVAVNRRGVVAYGYSASSNTTYAGAYASVGTSEDAFTVKNGLAPYMRSLDGSNLWGEYSGISVDPVDDSFWIYNQFADALGSSADRDGRWATAWGRLTCAPAPTPAPVLAPTPAPIIAPTLAPFQTKKSCGLFGLSLFCPFTLCGLLGRWLGLCCI